MTDKKTAATPITNDEIDSLLDAPPTVRHKGSNDDRLLDLFWNREEKKKRFSQLKTQLDNQGDELKEKDAEIERVKAQKRALEAVLGNTNSAYAALVYYHLRALWDTAHRQLESFCEELLNQQRDRERKKQIMEFNRARERQLASVATTIATVKAEADAARDQLQRSEAELAGMAGLLNFFSRRRLAPQVESQRVAYEAVRARIEELFDQRIKLESQPWPETGELTDEGKRVINLAVIAMAQHLFLHFADNNLGTMARTTTLKQVHEMDYGAREDCEFLMHRIGDAILSMKNDRSFAGPLRERAKYLRTIAQFREEHDTVPVAGSIGQILTSLPGVNLGNTVAGVPHDVNVMVEDYWNMSKVLLR
ncbi:MAG: hypothetical protein AB8G17_11650 [Gammaproteobacteria bacterium]